MAAPPSKFILPDLISHCSYPLRISPHRMQVCRASEAWIVGELTAACYPDADAFHLQVASDYLNFLFTFDDWSDEFDAANTHGLADCVMNALHDPEGYQTDKAAGKLAKCFFRRYRQTGGLGCIRRFIHTMDLFFKAVAQQAKDRTLQEIPDLEEYIALRWDTSGCKPCFALIEFAAGIDLPDDVVQHPTIQALEEATNSLVTWSNDIFSYNVEQARRDTHNMIVVVMQEQGFTLQEAINFVGGLCKASIDRFEADRRVSIYPSSYRHVHTTNSAYGPVAIAIENSPICIINLCGRQPPMRSSRSRDFMTLSTSLLSETLVLNH
ncbi:Alpha-muurolene synthase [Grifola frondosa]|uniref:Terpene synthase n=1 Tax=Grifola frondosa TaxID=5627 RepID=A0A1C7MC66_GRIFR|nr:Alpha-muurolene synthase [Grifola frondosa]